MQSEEIQRRRKEYYEELVNGESERERRTVEEQENDRCEKDMHRGSPCGETEDEEGVGCGSR